MPHARLRARLFPEDEVDRQYQAEETCEVVPAQGVRLHENQREQREDRERDHFLDDFQLPDRERPAELRRPDAVGRNLEAVFEQGDAPAEQYDSQHAEAFELGFECDVGQRVRPAMDVDTSEDCPSCFGTGTVKPSILFTDSLEEKIDCLVNKHHVKKFTLHVHPYVAAYVNKGLFPLSMKWKMKYTHGLKVIPNQSLAFLEYKFFDADKNELDMKEEKEIINK